MSLGHSPSIVTNGLVLCLDAANYKSFKGVNATNILNSIAYTQGNINNSIYKYIQGSENVNIPSIGYVNCPYVDFYNDYNGGSGNCCPNLFSYGTGLSVSSNTTYTYSIIYKTATGYSHPNYMYRYEYASNGSYVTESGVHSTGNRTSLGDGWWFAWGQFTTSATTATLNTYLFHYEYATQNRVYVYRAALYQGTYIIPPEHMLTTGQVRGTTVTTGGGWADLSTNAHHGSLVNSPVYNSSNGGSLVFDGIDDYVVAPNTSLIHRTSNWSYSAWVNFSGTPSLGTIFENGSWGNCLLIRFQTNGIAIYSMSSYWGFFSFSPTLGTWYKLDFIRNGNSIDFYLNGAYSQSINFTADIQPSPDLFIGSSQHASYQCFNGKIANAKIYNKALTAAEVNQNFNALKGRFGI
jgi:hypothetical protein